MMKMMVRKEKEKETNPNFAKDGEEPKPGQSTVDGHITQIKNQKKLNKNKKEKSRYVKRRIKLSSEETKTVEDTLNQVT